MKPQAQKLSKPSPEPLAGKLSAAEPFDRIWMELLRQKAEEFLTLTDGYQSLQDVYADHGKEATILTGKIHVLSGFLKESLRIEAGKSSQAYRQYLASARAGRQENGHD